MKEKQFEAEGEKRREEGEQIVQDAVAEKMENKGLSREDAEMALIREKRAQIGLPEDDEPSREG
jgi:hypothetical protein